MRKIAWEVLNRCEKAGQYSNLALDAAIRRTAERSGISGVDRGFLTALVYGVLERKITLDACIASVSERGEIAPDVRNLLRLGFYQLIYLDRVPDHAAVNETVSLAPRRAAGFVNALMRAFIRRGKEIPLPEREAEPVRWLSVRYSVCEPLCAKFLKTFGMERTESILRAYEEKPSVCLRVNPLRTTREKLQNALREAGYGSEPTGAAGLRVPGNAPVPSLPGYAEGWFFVQDEASQRCVESLDARPGQKVLDVCACPGSKSFGAAMHMNNEGELLACDLHASKLSLVTSGAERLGVTILSVLERDARAALPAWNGRADRVICDVPCSGFGVIAKKPELRYKDPAASASLPAVQREILERSAELLRAGGKLVYSTCTVFPEENGDLVRGFLNRHAEFALLEERPLFPDVDRTDGFYYAVLQKAGN